MWVATQPAGAPIVEGAVSIHATRVGGDAAPLARRPELYTVSIHATRVGGDAVLDALTAQRIVSIHATRVGGDGDWLDTWDSGDVSIHATRVGGDPTAN